MFCVVSTGAHVHLPHELPESGPSWLANTPMGHDRYICAYLPFVFRFLAQEISSIGPLQTGNNWNVSVAQLVGGG